MDFLSQLSRKQYGAKPLTLCLKQQRWLQKGGGRKSCPALCPLDHAISTVLWSNSFCIKGREPKALFGFYVWLCQLRLVASSSICNGSLTLCLGLYIVCERQRNGCWMDKKHSGSVELPKLGRAVQNYLKKLTLLLPSSVSESLVPSHQYSHNRSVLTTCEDQAFSLHGQCGFGKNQVPLDTSHIWQNPLQFGLFGLCYIRCPCPCPNSCLDFPS